MHTRFVRSMLGVAALGGVTGLGLALAQTANPQNAKPKMMPYTSVDHPEFVPASQADFLSDGDVLIGVSMGKIARAYPAADLAQHGAVLDQVPDGPIAVTW